MLLKTLTERDKEIEQKRLDMEKMISVVEKLRQELQDVMKLKKDAEWVEERVSLGTFSV